MLSVTIKGDAPAGLARCAAKYGKAYAQDIERVLRLETRHFMSGQWLGAGTAGMEVFAPEFPHGWGSLEEFRKSQGLPVNWFFTKTYTENGTGKKKQFIGFRDTGVFVDFISWFIKTKRGGDVVSWYMLPTPGSVAKRAIYRASLNKITPKFIV